MKITVVLPTFNHPERLSLCLNSYCRQTLPTSEFRILVADNQPTLATRKVIDDYSKTLKIDYIPNPINCQLTGNLALLMSKVDTPFVKIQYDDDIIYPEFLERSLSYIESSSDLVGYVCGGDFADENNKVINRFRPIIDVLAPTEEEFVIWQQKEIVSASFLASTISMHTGLYRTKALQSAFMALYPAMERSSYSGEKMLAAYLSDFGDIIYDRSYIGGCALWHTQSLTQQFGAKYREEEFQYTSELVFSHAWSRGFSPFEYIANRMANNPSCIQFVQTALARASGVLVDISSEELADLEQRFIGKCDTFRLPRFESSELNRRLYVATPFQSSVFGKTTDQVPPSLRKTHALILGRMDGEAWENIINELQRDSIEDFYWIHIFQKPSLWIEQVHDLKITTESFAKVDVLGIQLLPCATRSMAEHLRCAYQYYEIGELQSIGTAVEGSGFVLHGKIKTNTMLPEQTPMRCTSRIAIATPQLGGISETFIHRHIDNLPHCVVLTGDILNDYKPTVPTLRIPFQNGNMDFPPDWDLAIGNFLRQHKVEKILFEYGCYGTQLLYWNKRRMGLPAFVHFHGGDSSLTFLSKPEWIAYYRSLPNLVQGIFTGPQSMVRRLHSACDIPMAMLYPKRYGVEVPRSIVRTVPEGTIRLIFIGRLTPKKSPEDLLKAFRHAVSLFPDLYLDIVGDDGLSYSTTDNRRNLQELIEEWGLANKITMHGTLTPQRSRELLEQSHIYVQHSVTAPGGDVEGMPIVILEAAARGLPVISTRHEGIVEEVDEGVTGYLVDEHDYVGMGERIVSLAQHPERIVEMGMAGHAKMLRDFTVEREIHNLCYLMGVRS